MQDARIAANIVNPGQDANPALNDALQILRFVVSLPAPNLDAIYRR
jgi:hypothetical protein